jgi:hypothetical protein
MNFYQNKVTEDDKVIHLIAKTEPVSNPSQNLNPPLLTAPQTIPNPQPTPQTNNSQPSPHTQSNNSQRPTSNSNIGGNPSHVTIRAIPQDSIGALLS